MNGATPIDLQFPDALPVAVDMVPIQRGMQGPAGPQGPDGQPGNAVELPDFTLIFENALI